MKKLRHLDEILAEREQTGRIPRDKVLTWMGTQDLEALGALYHSLSDRRFTARIEPPLLLEMFQSFARAYFASCLRQDPQGVWVDSRYSAAWDLVGWIASLWKNRSAHEAALAEWKKWLAEVYQEGDLDVRSCLVAATLEHLFEHPGMADYLADWSADPNLADAYREAKEWIDRGGRSPLQRRRDG